MADYEDVREWADVRERDVLVLNTTMTCPLSCSFCCYGCHPGRKEKMPLDRALDLIDQAADLPCFTSVGFTGGEPLVHRADFAAMTRRLADYDLPYTVATSGYWGADPGEAEALAAEMAATGLRRMNISCDPAHIAFVSRETIETAALASAAHGIPVYIVGTFDAPGARLEDFVPGVVGIPNVRLVSKVVAQVGRATKWQVDYAMLRTPKVKTCYRRVHHDIVVFWDGKVYPCCSTFNRASPGLCVGNAFEEPLSAIRDRVEASLLFRVLKRQGFPAFHAIIARYDPALDAEMPQFDDYPGACSACSAIFRAPGIAERVEAVFDRYRADEIVEAIGKVENLLGETKAAAFFEDMLAECS